MFFERINNFKQSLAFRLALLYAAMFALSTFVVFLIFYEMIIIRVHTRVDSTLEAKMKKYSTLLASSGIGSIKEEITAEAKSVGTNKIFFRLLTIEGNELASSDLRSWDGVGISRIALKNLAEGRSVFESVKPPDWKYKVRVLYGIVGPGMVMQIGESSRDDEHFFEDLREFSGTVIIVLLVLGGLVGWLVAKRGLSGVEKVTQTAMAIADGAMEKRVPVVGKGDEIDRLSGVFNYMLDRIQSLINEMKEVTDNVAHDIKSPITRIRGLVEVTLTSAVSLDEYQSMAVSAIEECDRLLKMINTMLEISETEAGVVALSLSEVNISELIEEACDLFQPLAEGKGLSIEVSVPRLCLLRCDKNKLQRVVTNLLDNAIKYASSGKITVSAEQYDRKVIISVRDTGIGIPSSEIPHLFDRFFRVDKSRSLPGAGLGLSLVHAIVQKHGGEIKVSSTPGMGSTFTVALPQGNPLR
jgi:heavy metal sensor kinase